VPDHGLQSRQLLKELYETGGEAALAEMFAAQAGSEEPRPEAEMRDLAEWTGGQMIAVSERPPRLHPGITQEVAPDESQRAPKATT
jgi:hypothetical protein